MPTYRLTIEYDGSKFAGWQVQAHGRTVQGVLLDAVRTVLGEKRIDLQGAGRTDAGVHALGQVASLRCPRPIVPGHLLTNLERELPPDLAVIDVRPAPRGFHARHDAVSRVYRYQIATRRSAFGKRFTWWVSDPLHVEAMREAARVFEGRHDYAAFARRSKETESTLVVVERCEVVAVEYLVLVRITASHFLWNQVRRMVGALVTVGRGDTTPADVAGWLAGTAAPPPQVAPAAGLFLEAVRYGDEPEVSARLEPLGVPVHRPEERATIVPRDRGRS